MRSLKDIKSRALLLLPSKSQDKKIKAQDEVWLWLRKNELQKSEGDGLQICEPQQITLFLLFMKIQGCKAALHWTTRRLPVFSFIKT